MTAAGDAADAPANAHRALAARYLRRVASGCVVETPAEPFLHVARAVAEAECFLGPAEAAERREAEFHGLLASPEFLPNSPMSMNAHTPIGQLAACFVLPIENTLESFDCLRTKRLPTVRSAA